MKEEYSQSQMIGIGVAFMILPIVFVGLRVWAKAIGRRKLTWDDYIIFISLVRRILLTRSCHGESDALIPQSRRSQWDVPSSSSSVSAISTYTVV